MKRERETIFFSSIQTIRRFHRVSAKWRSLNQCTPVDRECVGEGGSPLYRYLHITIGAPPRHSSVPLPTQFPPLQTLFSHPLSLPLTTINITGPGAEEKAKRTASPGWLGLWTTGKAKEGFF